MCGLRTFVHACAGQVNMFQRVSGFHIVFDKDQPHENVKKFSVNLLNLSRNNRHLDNQVHLALSLHYMPPCWPWARCRVSGVVSGKEGERTAGRQRVVCGEPECVTLPRPGRRDTLNHLDRRKAPPGGVLLSDWGAEGGGQKRRSATPPQGA